MRSTSVLALTAVTTVLFTACGFERGPDEDVHAGPADFLVERAYPPGEAPDEPLEGTPHERFFGTWLINQPYHAGYEASFYTFGSDGTLVLEGNTGFNELETVGVVSGHEEPCEEWGCGQWSDDAVFCAFGSKWSATAIDTVLIEGVCDDEQTRMITLTFVGEPAGNAEGWGVEAVDAALEGYAPTHTGHPGFHWRYIKCFDLDGAPLVEDSDGWSCEQFAQLEGGESP